MSKTIRNIHELASHFGTIESRLEAHMSDRARCDVHITQYLTWIRLDVEIDGTNATFSCNLKYPFETLPVEVFLDTVCHNACEADPFDDPYDMLMNMSDPGEDWSIEDAGKILSEAEAQGWRFNPDVDAQFILDLYNNMEPEGE